MNGLLLAFCCCLFFGAHAASWGGLLKRTAAAGLFPLFAFGPPSVAFAQDSLTFQEWQGRLADGTITKVIFKGVRPTYLEAFGKNGEAWVVKEGFPSFDDPLSPSGPVQAVALCQHTPGVVCTQDISDALILLKSGKPAEMKPMLSHASYPKELSYENAASN